MSAQNKISVVHREECRICQSRSMARILSLPKMPFPGDIVTRESLGKVFVADVDIYICLDCYTAQTQYDVDLEEYYNDYSYSTGTSPVTNKFMEHIASALTQKYFRDSKKLKVLEIGSGDGSQLLVFKQMGCDVLGYEPSSYLTKLANAKGIPIIQGLFNKESINALPQQFKNVDIIFLSYTFDHLPNPIEFLQTIKSMINTSHGMLVIEVHDLEKLFLRREYCLFAHEHPIYLTRRTAQTAMEKEGFAVIDYDIVPDTLRRANSLIFAAVPGSSIFASARLPIIKLPEFQNVKFYEAQTDKIREGIRNIDIFIETLTRKGRKIAGYGAGGRGVMTLAAINNAGRLAYVVDKNMKGNGMYTPKSGIPVYGLEKLKKSPVNDIIVFSFGYMEEIQRDVRVLGYSPGQLHSIVDILDGKAVR